MKCIELISFTQLTDFLGNEKRSGVFVVHINEAMNTYQINTSKRIAAFLAQTGHETGLFRWMRELASGKTYEGRKDLGNIYPGDGEKFKGRGLLMITGRTNYFNVSIAIFGTDRLLQTPDLLAAPHYACSSAAWWWSQHGLNELADKGKFKQITKTINGGYNGEAEREAYYHKALEILQLNSL